MSLSNSLAAMEADTARHPVCGMTVSVTPSARHAEQAGHSYYFCSSKCREKFLANPSMYTDEHDHRASIKVVAGTTFTCPMHPEIRQDHPGNCPICGMALEPLVATGEHVHNLELADMSRRFWIGLGLAIPVALLGMGGELLGLNRIVPPALSQWIQFAFATPVVWWAGWPFFKRAFDSLLWRSLNMFTLIALGTGAAWGYSVTATAT